MNDEYLSQIDNMLDPIKHCPCTYEGCKRKSVMRTILDDHYVSACEDHINGLLKIIKEMGYDMHVRINKE